MAQMHRGELNLILSAYINLIFGKLCSRIRENMQTETTPGIWKTNHLHVDSDSVSAPHLHKPHQIPGHAQVLAGWMDGRNTVTPIEAPITLSSSLNYCELNSQWHIHGTFCTQVKSFDDNLLDKSACNQKGSHEVLWSVGDRLHLRKGTARSDTELIERSVENPSDDVLGLKNGVPKIKLNCQEDRLNAEVKAETTLALTKLQEACTAASVALRETTDAREQTLQARREALAARRESIEAQAQAMKAKNEALRTRRETAEARKALAEATKAITAMVEDVQQLHTGFFGKITDHRTLDRFTKENNENGVEVIELEKGKGFKTNNNKGDSVFDEKSKERNKESLTELNLELDTCNILRSSKHTSHSVEEPRVIITNSQTVGIVAEYSYEYERVNPIKERSLTNNLSDKQSEFLCHETSSSIHSKVAVEKAKDSCVNKKNHTTDGAYSCTVQRSRQFGADNVLEDITEIGADPISPAQRGSRRRREDPGSSSDQSDSSDDGLSTSETKAAKAPTAGSFAQKWGDFIGRISTLMITLVTAVNTAEALVESILAASWAKAGTFLFLLVCIHIPVAVVMVWLLLKDKIQLIRDVVSKAKIVVPLVIKTIKRIVARGSPSNGEVEELTEVEDREANCRNDRGSIFVVETKPQGIVNGAFTDGSQHGCSPT